MITLQAAPREGGSADELRKNGQIPAVVYGPKQDSLVISVPLHEFEAILRHEGESSLIELQGLDKPIQALIHDIDRDPVTSTPRHADFYAVEKGAKVNVSVPLSFVGESEAVKLGASMVKVLHEIDIEADPSKIPHEIEVDISALAEQGDQIHVSDLKAPAGVTITTDGEETVALVQAVAVEEETTEALDMEAIEVEQKGKGDEEAGAE